MYYQDSCSLCFAGITRLDNNKIVGDVAFDEVTIG